MQIFNGKKMYRNRAYLMFNNVHKIRGSMNTGTKFVRLNREQRSLRNSWKFILYFIVAYKHRLQSTIFSGTHGKPFIFRYILITQRISKENVAKRTKQTAKQKIEYFSSFYSLNGALLCSSRENIRRKRNRIPILNLAKIPKYALVHAVSDYYYKCSFSDFSLLTNNFVACTHRNVSDCVGMK